MGVLDNFKDKRRPQMTNTRSLVRRTQNLLALVHAEQTTSMDEVICPWVSRKAFTPEKMVNK